MGIGFLEEKLIDSEFVDLQKNRNHFLFKPSIETIKSATNARVFST
jgi:hypothetical protein